MNKIRIGTRGSKLALKQAALVQAALREAESGLETEIVAVHTKGDRIQDKPLTQIGGKGVFAAELERALQDGEIDIAVHSAKDLPVSSAEGLLIAAVLPRGDVRDVLVVPGGGRLPLPAGGGAETAEEKFVIGTGSRRRRQQAGRLWENVVCEDIRGNVDTRLQKLLNGNDGAAFRGETRYHGIILAKAGLDRLGITLRQDGRFDFYPLSPEEFLPAACQGIIAVQAVQDSAAAALCREISDGETELCFLAEREVLSSLAADCREEIAVWCRREADHLTLDVMYAGNRRRLTCAADFRPETEGGQETADPRAGIGMARQAAKLVKDKDAADGERYCGRRREDL